MFSWFVAELEKHVWCSNFPLKREVKKDIYCSTYRYQHFNATHLLECTDSYRHTCTIYYVIFHVNCINMFYNFFFQYLVDTFRFLLTLLHAVCNFMGFKCFHNLMLIFPLNRFLVSLFLIWFQFEYVSFACSNLGIGNRKNILIFARDIIREWIIHHRLICICT